MDPAFHRRQIELAAAKNDHAPAVFFLAVFYGLEKNFSHCRNNLLLRRFLLVNVLLYFFIHIICLSNATT